MPEDALRAESCRSAPTGRFERVANGEKLSHAVGTDRELSPLPVSYPDVALCLRAAPCGGLGGFSSAGLQAQPDRGGPRGSGALVAARLTAVAQGWENWAGLGPRVFLVGSSGAGSSETFLAARQSTFC